MYTVVFKELKTVGDNFDLIQQNDPICILQWPEARIHVTLHYRNVKANVSDNHIVSRVEQNNNKNVHLSITFRVFFHIKHVKKENNSDFKRKLSLTFSKNTLSRRITYNTN